MNLLECNHLRMTFAWCDKPSPLLSPALLAGLTNCTGLLSELIELSSHESWTELQSPTFGHRAVSPLL